MELDGVRLVLRPVTDEDLDFYVALRNSPDVIRWTGARGRRDRSDVERDLLRWVEHWREHGFGTWTVFGRQTDERLGRVELDPVGDGWTQIATGDIEIGCVIDPAHWNEGIATEATLLVIDDCCDRVGLDRLVAMTTADNVSSLRALEKVGMSYVGGTQRDGPDSDVTYQLFELRWVDRRRT